MVKITSESATAASTNGTPLISGTAKQPIVWSKKKKNWKKNWFRRFNEVDIVRADPVMAKSPWDHDSECLNYDVRNPKDPLYCLEEVKKEISKEYYNNFKHLPLENGRKPCVYWKLLCCKRCENHTLVPQLTRMETKKFSRCKDC